MAATRYTFKSIGIVAADLMNSPPSPGMDDVLRKGILGETWKFLNRDIRTFKWLGQRKTRPEPDELPEPEPKALTEPIPKIVSEVDPRQIEVLRSRREVLDWRDAFHFEVTETASQAQKALAERVEYELSSLGFFRLRLFTKPASEVLERHIASCVQSAMRQTLDIEQAALRQRLLTWGLQRQEPASLSTMWPKLEWDTRLALPFTADHREQILTLLYEMMLGENGIADRHRQWATQYAGQILEMQHAQPDSV